MTARRAAVVAVALSLLAAACSSGSSAGGDGGTATSATLDDSTSTTEAAIALALRDPTQLLVADGIQFGTAPPPLAASLDAYRDDVAVLDADGAIAWGPGPSRIAEVAVLALDPAAFPDQSLLDVYVERLATTARGGAGHAMTFQRDNLLAVLRGGNPAWIRDLAARMQAAFDAGRTGTDARFTPLRSTPAGSVFVALRTARFDPYPSGDEPTPTSTPTTQPPAPPPPAPALPGIAGVQTDLRRVVVANEVRALAWALAAPVTQAMSAEQVDRAIPGAVESRAGRPASAFVVDRLVWAADPTDDRPAVRAFRHNNVVVVVEGADPIQLDALVASWITALGSG